jgi:hypothetical protein
MAVDSGFRRNDGGVVDCGYREPFDTLGLNSAGG